MTQSRYSDPHWELILIFFQLSYNESFVPSYMTELSRRVDVSDISIKKESQSTEISNKIDSHSNISARPPQNSSQTSVTEEKLSSERIFYVRLEFEKFDDDYIQVRDHSQMTSLK